MSLVNIYYMRSLDACAVCAVSRKQNTSRDDDNLSIDRDKPIDVSKAVQVYAHAINIYTEKQQRIYCMYTHTTVCVCVCGVYTVAYTELLIEIPSACLPAERLDRPAQLTSAPRKNLDICKL